MPLENLVEQRHFNAPRAIIEIHTDALATLFYFIDQAGDGH